MDRLSELSQYPYFNEAAIVIGALLVVFGVLKIVSSSLKLVGWVVLAGIGVFAVVFGMERGDVTLPANVAAELRTLAEPGKELSVGALRSLCTKLDEG